MKIESNCSKIEVLDDVLTFENKVKSKYKKGIYNFKILKMEDIKKLKEFFKKFKKSMCINFYYDIENEQIEIEFENIKTSKILENIIIDVID